MRGMKVKKAHIKLLRKPSDVFNQVQNTAKSSEMKISCHVFYYARLDFPAEVSMKIKAKIHGVTFKKISMFTACIRFV
jgi:hypothetical protein